MEAMRLEDLRPVRLELQHCQSRSARAALVALFGGPPGSPSRPPLTHSFAGGSGSLVFTLVRRTGLHYLSLAGASLERPEGDGGGQVSCSLAYGAFWSSASRMPQLKVFL